MSQKIRIPYAVSNFEKIKREGYFFIDKTKYITILENYTAPVFLRPRRFGKTLMCSILECYYDINRSDSFNELFGDTWIGKNPTVEKNSCMVMRFNFSEISVSNSIGKIETSFNNITKAVINFFLSYYKNYFPDITFDFEKVSDILSSMLKFVKDNNLPPVYIIIDEYDNFTNQLIQSHQDGMYENLTTGDSFLRTFFKVIKAGTEDLSVRRCYITGVLPITIDDLTSGFNITDILTLKKKFVSMLGFTQPEIDNYLDAVFNSYGYDRNNYEVIKNILKKYYNGYKFLPEADSLYNSTILTFFLREFIDNEGNIPSEFIDDNIKTDVSWIQRLTVTNENTKKMLETLIFERELEYDYQVVRSKFNMRQFFEESSYPVSLFYLGMLTFQDDYTMAFPNQTMETIFAGYFNEVEKISVSEGYTKYFRQFMKDMDLEKLFAGYFERYIGQIPAQAFDKVNENFYRTTFYELCTRYLFRDFVFNIESNYPSGRSDLEVLGKYHTKFKNLKWVIEFKHFSKEKAKKEGIYDLKQARAEEVDQVSAYADDILKDFPNYNVTKFVIYTISSETFKVFTLPKNNK